MSSNKGQEPLSLDELDRLYQEAAASGSDGITEIIVPTDLAPAIKRELDELDRENNL